MKNSKNANPKWNIGLKSILKHRGHHNARHSHSDSSDSEDDNGDVLISFDDLQEAESNHIYKSAQDLEFAENEALSSRREKKHARQLATPET